MWSEEDFNKLFGDIPPQTPEEKAQTILEHILSVQRLQSVERKQSWKIRLYHMSHYGFYKKTEPTNSQLAQNEIRVNLKREEIPAFKTAFIQSGYSLFIESGGKILVISK